MFSQDCYGAGRTKKKRDRPHTHTHTGANVAHTLTLPPPPPTALSWFLRPRSSPCAPHSQVRQTDASEDDSRFLLIFQALSFTQIIGDALTFSPLRPLPLSVFSLCSVIDRWSGEIFPRHCLLCDLFPSN